MIMLQMFSDCHAMIATWKNDERCRLCVSDDAITEIYSCSLKVYMC